MSKNIILVLSLITISLVRINSQNISWPNCSYVETEDNFKNLIKVTLDNNGKAFLGEKQINNLETDLYEQFKYQMKNKQLDFSLTKIEIQADSTILLKHISSFLFQLAELNMNSVFFVTKSEHYSRIKDIWSIGLNHDLFSVYVKTNLKDSLRNELNIPPLPPPPPGYISNSPYDPKTSYTLEHFHNNMNEYIIHEVFLSDENIIRFDKSNLDIKQYLNELKTDLEKGKTIILLNYSPKTEYRSFISFLSKIKELIYELREKYCQENLMTSYNDLNYSEKKIINDMYPYLLKIKKNDL